jgi:hypothetical protein
MTLVEGNYTDALIDEENDSQLKFLTVTVEGMQIGDDYSIGKLIHLRDDLGEVIEELKKIYEERNGERWSIRG